MKFMSMNDARRLVEDREDREETFDEDAERERRAAIERTCRAAGGMAVGETAQTDNTEAPQNINDNAAHQQLELSDIYGQLNRDIQAAKRFAQYQQFKGLTE